MIVIGIDVGGTSIKGAFINEKGNILSRFSMKVNKRSAPEKEVKELCSIINKSIKENKYTGKVSGIGIGMPGIMDFDSGLVINSPNLPTWNNFNLKAFIHKETGLNVEINNDANVAALGEATFGSGKKYKNIIMITLGTGVGGGIVIDGKIVDGHLHQGAELGHMVISVGGRKCGCGRRGCFEAYASASALIKETKKMMKRHPESLLYEVGHELGGVDARNAFVASKRGDKCAIKLVDEYVMYLSEGLINYCNIFRPEAIILSGGVANEGEYLFNKVKDYMAEHNFGMKGSPKVEILPSELGYDSGKIGAACLLLNK